MNEDSIESLLKAAGPRPEPDAEMMEAMRQTTHQAWLEVVAEENRKEERKWRNYANVAAMFIVVVGFLGLNSDFYSQETIKQLASISFINGSYQINGETYTHVTPLMTGDTIQTDDSSLMSIMMEDETLITLAPDTALTFNDKDSINLSKGRVYVDSPNEETAILIATSWGSIEDIGTQYEIEVTDKLTVAMRQGKVKILMNDTPYFASFKSGLGDVLSIDKNMKIERVQIESTDARWNWATEAAPHKSIEGISVHEFMVWAGRVTGKEIIYSDKSTQVVAINTRLHGGRVDPMKIDSMLHVLLKTTRLSAVVSEHNISVENNSNN